MTLRKRTYGYQFYALSNTTERLPLNRFFRSMSSGDARCPTVWKSVNQLRDPAKPSGTPFPQRIQVSTETGLCGVLDYAELVRGVAQAWAFRLTRTAHSHRASRKLRRLSLAVNRTGLGVGSSIRLRAASFIARSAST